MIGLFGTVLHVNAYALLRIAQTSSSGQKTSANVSAKLQVLVMINIPLI